MAAKGEVFRRADNEWSWRLKAGNGEIVAVGEGYSNRTDALRGFHDAVAAAQSANDVTVEE
jgi:hypothetical protein